MKKFFISLILLASFFHCSSCFALDKNIEKLKEYAIKNAIDPVAFDANQIKSADPNYIENNEAISKGYDFIVNRQITAFSDGYYSVKIYDKNNYEETLIYDPKNKLKEVHIIIYPNKLRDQINQNPMSANNLMKLLTTSIAYPNINYAYSYTDGKLKGFGIYVSSNDTYSFDSTGKFKGHWLNRYLYDVNGKAIMKR